MPWSVLRDDHEYCDVIPAGLRAWDLYYTERAMTSRLFGQCLVETYRRNIPLPLRVSSGFTPDSLLTLKCLSNSLRPDGNGIIKLNGCLDFHSCNKLIK